MNLFLNIFFTAFVYNLAIYSLSAINIYFLKMITRFLRQAYANIYW